jgi:hypothetical protein
MKDQIIERLLNQGHITIEMADILINNRLEKSTLIAELNRDGQINIKESIILLRDEEPYMGFNPIMPPSMPFKPYQPDWTYDPHRTGQPWWTVTSSNQPFEYPDTKWPGDKPE